MHKVWIKAEFWVGQTFSYRAPDFSSNYALSAPLPGPSATKLALVSTAIEMSRDVNRGKQVFNLVKSAEVLWEPSDFVGISKMFLRRFYKGEPKSFGIREYCTYSGPIILYLSLNSEDDAEQIINVLKQIRRMGSSDSILTLKCPPQILDKEPELKYTYHPISQVEIDTQNFTHRLVLPLKDLDESDTFEKINPYESGNPKLKQEVYIFPLKLEKKAENWTLYKKCPFNRLKKTHS